MSEDPVLERARLVAKQAISEELKTNVCQACGCNPTYSQKYLPLQDAYNKINKRLKEVMAEAAWMKHCHEHREWERRHETDGLQSKVRKQRQALARLYIEVEHLKAELKRGGQCVTPTSSEDSETETT